MSLATLRNIAIIFAIAAAVEFLPGARTGRDIVARLLSVVFLGGIAWLGARLYREHRATIFGLGDRYRAMLYGAVGAIVFAVAAAPKLFDTGAGTIVWFAVVGASVYLLVVVFRHWRSYA